MGSICHGGMDRARRRIENTQFRADTLRLYERELFPRVMNDLLDVLIAGERADLFEIGELLSVVLAARRAGIDHDASLDDLRALVHHVDLFSQGSAILVSRHPYAERALVQQTYSDFERDFVRPSRARRQGPSDGLRPAALPQTHLP